SSAHSSQQNPSHTYTAAGTYAWTLTVSISGATACIKTGSITASSNCSAPSIATQPVSQTIDSGQSASLNILANGTAPLAYQWYQGASGDTSSPIPGATSSSYVTPPLTTDKRFWVRVMNACGTANSNAATITVGTSLRPVASFTFTPQAPTSGQPVQFTD